MRYYSHSMIEAGTIMVTRAMLTKLSYCATYWQVVNNNCRTLASQLCDLCASFGCRLSIHKHHRLQMLYNLLHHQCYCVLPGLVACSDNLCFRPLYDEKIVVRQAYVVYRPIFDDETISRK